MFDFLQGIRKKVFLSHAVIILPLLLVIVFIHYSHYIEKRDDIITARVVFARNVASNFDQFIKEVSTTEKAVGTAVVENDYTRREASEYLARFTNRYPLFSLDYVRTSGEIFASSDPGLVGTTEAHGQYDINYYVKSLRPDKEWVVSPLHAHANGIPGFDIATGIWRGSKLAGVMVASIDSTRLNEILVFDVPGGGYNITDSNGMLIFQNQRPGVPLSHRDWSSHEFIKAARAGKEFTSNGLTFPIDNSFRMGAQVPIHSIGWSAGSFVPVDEVMAVIRTDLFTSGIVASIVVILAAILGRWLGRRIADPIALLAGKAKTIADGSFDEEIEGLKTGDEIGELAESFDSMRISLKEYVNELSGLVEVGEKMNLALNVPFVENAVTNALRTYFDAKAIWITLYDDREKLVKVDHFWAANGADMRELTIALGQDAVSKVLMTGKPHIIKNMASSEVAFGDLALKYGIDTLITLPLISGGGTLGIIELYTPLVAQNRITDKEMGLLMALSNQAAVAIENAVLYEETRKSELRLRASNEDLRILNKVALDISSGLDLNELLEKTVNNAVELVGADMGMIGIYDKDNRKVEHEYRTSSPDLTTGSSGSRDFGLIGAATKTQKSIFTNDYQRDPRLTTEALSLGVNAAAAIPLIIGNHIIGVLQIGLTGNKAFTENDIALLEAVAGQSAVAIENARLYAREKDVAETLQNALLAMPDELTGVELGLLYRSATDKSKVGGDFYDFIEFTDGRIGVVVGDVSGKGLEAAAATALAKMTIRAFAYEYESPAEVLEHGNVVISSQLPTGQFITMAYVAIDPATGEFSYASAGHPAPLVVNHRTHNVRQLRIGALPLGVMDNPEYQNYYDVLADGEVILLYTDGLLEARDEGELFGEEGIGKALLNASDLDVEQIPESLLAAAKEFSHGKLSDDVAIIALSLDGSRKDRLETGVKEETGNGEAKDVSRLGDYII